jgi:hypothetical protein
MVGWRRRLFAMRRFINMVNHANYRMNVAAVLVLAFLALTPFTALPVVDAAPEISLSVGSQILVAGAENEIVLTLSNTGTSQAGDLNVTVSVPTNNMLLVDSDGSWNFTHLNVGQTESITVKAYVVASAAGSLIQLTVRVSYESMGTRTESFTLGFSVATIDLNGAYLNPHFSALDFNASKDNYVHLIIENEGGREATNISVSLGMPGGLGTGLGGLSSLTSLTGTSSLSSGSTQFLIYNTTGRWNFESLPSNGSLMLPLAIFVLPEAAGSISMFPVTLSYTDGFSYTEVTRYATVRVASVPSTDINFHVSIDPQEFGSGEVTHANINVTNMGGSNMKAVTIQLSLSGSFISSSSGSGAYSGTGFSIPSSTSSPFVLLGQDGSWYFEEISAGESRSIPVEIYTSPSASGSVTTASVALSYTDSMYKSKSETKVIGIIVKGVVDIYVLSSSTFPQTIVLGKTFAASINIINLGSSSAKGLLVFPKGNGNLTVASTASIFLGDVDVNIPTSLTLSYVASNITNGTYMIHVPFTYKDSLGEWLNGTLDVPLKLTVSNASASQSTETGSFGIGELLVSYWWLLLIAVIAAVLVAYRLLKRRKSRL